MNDIIIEEKKQSLFSVSMNDYVLVHCISQDCAFGEGKTGHYGIAWDMQQYFPGIKKNCLKNNPEVGKAILFISQYGWVFNLVTKRMHYDKPTYENLRKTIKDMREYIETYEIKQLAMPLIGCGLDRLAWDEVKEILQSELKGLQLKILVCIK